MVYRRNLQTKKKRLSSKKTMNRPKKFKQQTSSSIPKQTLTENLDDETKLAKRHLTKEMWQLVSIAVKRMADELVAISNNQQSTTTSNNHQPTLIETNNVPIQTSETSTIEQSMITNTGAGDEPYIKENLTVVKDSTKRNTLPLQMLEPSVYIKRKGSSNNATERLTKSKRKKRPSSLSSKKK